jgi:hypothetical protein
MLAKIEEILGRKPIKYSLLVISIIGFAVCIIIMQAQIIDIIVGIIEKNILHRNMKSLNKWKDYLFGEGYSFSVFFVIVWYFFIKRKFYGSSFFLLFALSIYLYTYNLFALSHSWRDLLRFPIIILLVTIVTHIVVNRRYFYPFTNSIKSVNRYLIENRFLNSSFFVFICGALLGALFFLYIFGNTILDFTYTDWLMVDVLDGSDLPWHSLGWKLFRNSSWSFPFGLIDNIVYPFKISIIYTDSIPLFAIIFKLLSPVLPENFQYFGLFGIICYILQGGFGALIIRKIGGNTGQSIIGSLFFTISTVMMWRIYFHTSLTAHFIILLCILAYLQNNFDLKKQIFMWGFLIALSVSIHLYFVPMVMIFMFFRFLQEYVISGNFKNQCIVFFVSVLILTGTMFCFGAFYFAKSVNTVGMEEANANLNVFINPQGTSTFIKDLPLVAISFPHEGFSYLGFGVILFVIFILIQLCQRKKSDLPIVEKEKMLPILGIVLSFLLFSLSPTITLNQFKLFTYPVLPPVEYLWSIFRSTGRMTWPIIYITITFCIWWAITQFSVKKSILFLSVFLLIQWVDLKPWFVNKGDNYKTKLTWQTKLSSPVWDNLASEYKHIFFMSNYTKLHSFLDLAGNRKITVNDANLARTNQRMIDDNKQKEAVYLINNGPRNDMVYIFQDEEQASLFKETGIHFFIIDEVIIGIDSKKTYLDNYKF